MQVSGVERYDPVLVPRLARLNQGDVYDLSRLVEAQQRLASSGYFDSAYVFINPENDPQAVPVQVQVREAKLQKVVLGVGVTTDSGPRASVEHTHHRVPGIGWRAVTKLQLEKKSPFAQTEWTAIPDEANWRWGALGRVERINDNELITQAQRLRFGRSQIGDRIDRNIYLQYDRANVQGTGLLGNTAADTGDGSALTANYVWTGRYFDSLPFPSQGYALGFELGAGTTLGQDRQPFTRTVGRWLGIKPLERGRIAMRAEAGAVLAKDTRQHPGHPAVSHRRRHHGARLRLPRHRHRAGQWRDRPRPLPGGGQRRVAAAHHAQGPAQRIRTHGVHRRRRRGRQAAGPAPVLRHRHRRALEKPDRAAAD